MTEAGSLKLIILFISFPASFLQDCFCGSIPITPMVAVGWSNNNCFTKFRVVLATVAMALWFILSLKLFAPTQSRMLAGMSGQEPWSARHATCSTRSPPIPWLIQSGRYSWRREEWAGRASLSHCESPNKMLLNAGKLIEDTQWASYLSPQVVDGSDLFMW